MTKQHSPHLITSLIDLTTLSGQETEADILKLCAQAQTENGNVAAVCLYPKFISTAKSILQETGIKVATVVNFPSGEAPLEESIAAINSAINNGADEIDLVMPYKQLQAGNISYVADYLNACRTACTHHSLKIIIESGELNEEEIKQACELVIVAKADFIKTSTGKSAHGASPEAAKLILQAIKHAETSIGIKLSGGVRTVEMVEIYLKLAETYLGKEWVAINTFRIGASKLPT